MPLSAQLVGRAYDETMLLRVAAAYERATQWNRHRPPGGAICPPNSRARPLRRILDFKEMLR